VTKKLVSFDEATGQLPAAVEAVLDTAYGPVAASAAAAALIAAEHATERAFQSSTYGRIKGAGSGPRLVALGDSTIAADSSNAPSWGGRDFVAMALILSGGAFRYVRNAGIAGNKSADMLARFSTDVTPYAPDVVLLVAGINDAVTGTVTLATYAANMRAIVANIRAIGAVAWIGNVAPNLNTGGTLQKIDTYNAWLREFTAAENIPLLDLNTPLTDPATGQYLGSPGPGGMTLDGTHQDVHGALAVGQALATLATANLPSWSPHLPTYNTTDLRSQVANGLFLASSAGLGTSWLQTGGTASIITGDTTIKGNWQRLTDLVSGTINIRQNITLAPTVIGDTLRISGRCKHVMGTSVSAIQMFFTCSGSGITNYIMLSQTQDFAGVFEFDVVVPAGTSSLQFQMARVVTTAGTGYSQIAQIAVRNLTQLGILTA
jgi:lysophospholipase L1-like esterase